MQPWSSYQTSRAIDNENTIWTKEDLQALVYEKSMSKEPKDWTDVPLKIASKVSLISLNIQNSNQAYCSGHKLKLLYWGFSVTRFDYNRD